MNGVRVWNVLRKDLRLGPRSPLFLYAFVVPVVLTVLIRGVFGNLFEPTPRLGIVDEGQSSIVQAVRDIEGIEVAFPESADRLKSLVEANDLDAGLVLQPGFDAALRAGDRPHLQFFVGGESLAANRIILGVTAVDLIRGVAGAPAPIEVAVTTVGEGDAVPIANRLLPLVMLYAIWIGGGMVPAASLVEEKERRTLQALLVTPVQVADVLVGKGVLGIVLALAAGVVTLAINNAFGSQPAALLLTLALAALMSAAIGLLFGSWARDTNMLFTASKASGILLFAPVIFFIWPNLPQWIAKLFPTYYFLSPLFEIAIKGASLADVWPELAIGLALCAALFVAVFAMGRRLEVSLVTA